MTYLLRATLVAAVVTSASAWACHRGAHGHVGAGAASINLGFLSLFGVGVHLHGHAPCPEVVVQPQVVVAPAPVVVPPPPVVVTPPPVIEAPPPQVVYLPAPAVVVAPTPPPVVVAPPAPAPAPVVTAAPVRREPDRPSLIALKYLPGASGTFSAGDTVGLTGVTPSHSVGLELRVSRWFALRSDIEARAQGRSYDLLGGKLWLAPAHWGLRPYGSVSLSGSETPSQRGRMSIGVVGAAGLDLTFGKHFFLEAEARYRVAPGDCCRDVPQVTALVGGGIAFF